MKIIIFINYNCFRDISLPRSLFDELNIWIFLNTVLISTPVVLNPCKKLWRARGWESVNFLYICWYIQIKYKRYSELIHFADIYYLNDWTKLKQRYFQINLIFRLTTKPSLEKFSDDGFVVSRNIRLIWRYLCFAFVESFKCKMSIKWIYSEYRLYENIE